MQYFMYIWLKTLMVKYSNVQKIMTFLMYAVLLALCKNLSAKKYQPNLDVFQFNSLYNLL